MICEGNGSKRYGREVIAENHNGKDNSDDKQEGLELEELLDNGQCEM